MPLHGVMRRRQSSHCLMQVGDSSRHDDSVGMNPDLQPLLSYVQCQDTQVLPVVRDWLKDIYAVAEVAQGYAQRAQLPAGGWFVTPQGHLIGAHSVLFHAPDSQLHGVLARQREIEKLEQELAGQNRNAEYSRQQVAQAEQHYQSIEAQIAPLRHAGNELQQRLHGVQMNILKLNQAHERSAERTTQIEQEMQEVADQLGGEQRQQLAIDEQTAALREQNAAFHSQVDEAQRDANARDAALREQRERAQQAQHALQEARFFAKTCTEKIADLQHNIQQLGEALAQFEQNLIQLRADLSGSEDETSGQQLQDGIASAPDLRAGAGRGTQHP